MFTKHRLKRLMQQDTSLVSQSALPSSGFVFVNIFFLFCVPTRVLFAQCYITSREGYQVGQFEKRKPTLWQS